MPSIASTMARGTVRAVSRTSPLGTSADSTPAKANTRSSDVRATSAADGQTVTVEVLGSHQEQPADGDEQQRQQLGHGRHRVQARAEGDAAHVHQRPEPERHQQHVGLPRRERRDELPDAGGEHRRHGGGREQAEHPQQDAREERGVRPQRGADIRIGAAGERHAAARVRDAQHDQPHRHGADEVGDWRRGPEGAGDAGRQAEDAAADGDVDDGSGEAERTDGPKQRLGRKRRRLRSRCGGHS